MEQYKLKLLFWETTQKCNLFCSHCRMDEEKLYKEFSTMQAKYFIDSIVEFASPLLVFSGGEPLMRPDIFEIAQYASDKGLKTALATNGTLVDDQVVSNIKSTDIKRVSISLDGANKETHDIFRNSSGSFNKAVDAIKLLVSRNVSTQINASIAKHNINNIEEIVKLALSLKVDALHFFLIVPVGCAKKIVKSQILTSSEYEEALNNIYEMNQKYLNEIFIKVTCAPQYYRILKQKTPQVFKMVSDTMHQISKGCLAGTNVCFVSSSGDVYPCGYLPVSSGNVLDIKLRRIWENSQVFKTLRNLNDLEENCLSCSFTNVCGGCRARAYYTSDKNFMAKDPDCVINTPNQ